MYSKVLEKIKVVLGWIKKHKYIFVTLVFLAIILVIDDNSLISHMRNRAVIDDLETEIKQVVKDENIGVVLKFLKDNTNFTAEKIDSKLNGLKLDVGIQFLPDTSMGAGFYFAKLRKN